jgi:hypothetical protein
MAVLGHVVKQNFGAAVKLQFEELTVKSICSFKTGEYE